MNYYFSLKKFFQVKFNIFRSCQFFQKKKDHSYNINFKNIYINVSISKNNFEVLKAFY